MSPYDQRSARHPCAQLRGIGIAGATYPLSVVSIQEPTPCKVRQGVPRTLKEPMSGPEWPSLTSLRYIERQYLPCTRGFKSRRRTGLSGHRGER